MLYAFSLVKIFEHYNSSWGSSSVGTSLVHSCFSLCISYISLNSAFRAFAFFLLKGFFCRQFSYVLACFATTMSMATSFYYSYLWIATPCVTFVFCFMTICNNYFHTWFFFFFLFFLYSNVCVCYVVCTRFAIATTQASPIYLFLNFSFGFFDNIVKICFLFCYVLFCASVLSSIFQSRGACVIATMIPPCL